MDITVRAWTHGWNFYSPHVNICWTTFDRSYRPTFWENPKQGDLEKLSRLRIWYRLGMVPREDIPQEYHFIFNELEKYPMGTQRSIDDYWAFIEYDKRTECPTGNRIKALKNANKKLREKNYLSTK